MSIFGSNPQENVNYFVYLSAPNDGFDTVAIVSRYLFQSTRTYSDAGGGFDASFAGRHDIIVNTGGGNRLFFRVRSTVN